MQFRSGVALLCVAATLAGAQLSAQQTSGSTAGTLVRSDQLSCLLTHAERYLDTAGAVIVVPLEFCPNPNPSAADLAQHAQNALIPEAADEAANQADGPDTETMISLSQARLECLFDLYSSGQLDTTLSQAVVDLDTLC
ncbi:MAG: hypothetical protein AAGA28_14520 [Pseudomonadota bacterium]